jgi:hypothetical protein
VSVVIKGLIVTSGRGASNGYIVFVGKSLEKRSLGKVEEMRKIMWIFWGMNVVRLGNVCKWTVAAFDVQC